MIWGSDATPIPDGVIGVASFKIATTPASSTIPVQLSAITDASTVATDLTATAVAGKVTVVQTPPAAATVSGLNCSPLTFYTPGASTCTVTITGVAPSGGVTVPLNSNNSVLSVPSQVQVPAGNTTAKFYAIAASITAKLGVTVTAGNGPSATANFTLAPPLAISSIGCSPSTLATGASATCTLTMNEAVLGDISFPLTSGDTALTVPASVTLTTGNSSANFTAAAGAFTVVTPASTTIATSFQSQTLSTTITFQKQLLFKSLTCAATSLASKSSTLCTVTLSKAVSAPTTVAIASDNQDVTVPPSIVIQTAGATGTFSASTAALSYNNAPTANLTATSGKSSISVGVAVPLDAVLKSISCPLAGLSSQQSMQCSIALQPGKTTSLIQLSSSVTALTVPASVSVAPALATATFTATAGAVTSANTAIVTAKLNTQSIQYAVGLLATRVSPQAVPTGLFRVRVFGSGFTQKSVVMMDGKPLPTTFVSGGLLLASGTATRSQSSRITISDAPFDSAPLVLQIGIAQPRMNYSGAFRFLTQAAFGPTGNAIDHLQEIGVESWLNEQFAIAASTGAADSISAIGNAAQAPDQLRQRAAAAFTRILRPDSQGADLATEFADSVFGNYRELLARTHPADAVDGIFQQPSLGKTVATGLIQNLVKSNPSTEYVQRVASIFDNDGLGHRGDLRSVISAVLLDSEARMGDIPGNDGANTGRAQSAPELILGLSRALEQDPGTVTAEALTMSKARSAAAAGPAVLRNTSPAAWVGNVVSQLDLSAFESVAGSPDSLADALDVVLLGGQMSGDLRAQLIQAFEAQPDSLLRARLGVYMVAVSDEYSVRH